jgi:hypothetical protein
VVELSGPNHFHSVFTPIDGFICHLLTFRCGAGVVKQKTAPTSRRINCITGIPSPWKASRLYRGFTFQVKGSTRHICITLASHRPGRSIQGSILHQSASGACHTQPPSLSEARSKEAFWGSSTPQGRAGSHSQIANHKCASPPVRAKIVYDEAIDSRWLAVLD